MQIILHFNSNIFCDLLKVNIRGINKLQLFKALWDGSHLMHPYCNDPQTAPCNGKFDDKEATTILTNRKSNIIEDFCGRILSVCLNADIVYSGTYNIYTGKDNFQKIVDQLREKMLSEKKQNGH